MENNIKYQKTFLIFNQEDAGYGMGQEPAGHMKIEVREGKGRISLSVQNLREDQDRTAYKLYIVKCTPDRLEPLCAGDLAVKGYKAELEWDFNPQNVNMTGIPIEEFNMAVIAALDKDKGGWGYPLVAYKGEKCRWKDRLKEVLCNKGPDKSLKRDEEELLEKQDLTSKYKDDISSKNEKDIISKSDNQADYQIENEKSTEKMDEKNTESDSGVIIRDTGIQESVNPCLNCPAFRINDGEAEAEVDLVKMKEYFDKHFEASNPFRSNRKNYSWWKVGNPASLNNILYSLNIKNPVLFNPKVLMSYYKYRHLTVGIYDEMDGGRKYIVCGIPGVYGIDDKPFGAACRWVQIEGSTPKYGAFGYWLVYMDTKTGKLIN